MGSPNGYANWVWQNDLKLIRYGKGLVLRNKYQCKILLEQHLNMYFKGYKTSEYWPEINISNMDKASLLTKMMGHKRNTGDCTYIQWQGINKDLRNRNLSL